jgi:hypothetical protein
MGKGIYNGTVASFSFDGNMEKGEKFEGAMPQGSPASPVLYSIIISAIIDLSLNPLDDHTTGYVDDLNDIAVNRDITRATTILESRRRWLSGTIFASLVLDSTGHWVRISARTPILRDITTGGDITGGFFPGAGFPSCHKSIYRVSEDNFRGSACESEWMLISVKDGSWSFIT